MARKVGLFIRERFGVITGSIAGLMVVGVFTLLILRIPVPTELWSGFGLVLGALFAGARLEEQPVG